MKRKIDLVLKSIESTSKKQKIRATDLKNYMIKDPLVDFLKLKKPVQKATNNFSSFIMKKGCEFETELIKYINTNKHPVVSINSNEQSDTIKLMKQGIPIIHSAPLSNRYNNTGGTADLLVRSDYLHRIVNESPLTEEEQKIESPKLGFPFHYVVIDIKFTTIPFKSDGKHILNSGMFPAYKSQTLIYNDALSYIQGYKPRYSYILGRRWKCNNKNGNLSSFDCLDKLGVIDYQGVDKSYVIKTKSAVSWVKNVNANFNKWTVEDTDLQPNMCVNSNEYNKEKSLIADNIGDITTLWFCGPKNREIALKNGISSWRDKRCNSKNLGIKGNRAKILNSIIKINQQNKIKILPKIIKNDISDWKTPLLGKEAYIDFETISDIFAPFSELPKQKNTDMIFMIGVGWESPTDGWKYKKFICNKADLEEEFRIMNEFMIFIQNFEKKFYWCAERRFWDIAERRQFDRLSNVARDSEQSDMISDHWKLNLDNWIDMCNIFKSEPIVIKDCFNFGLKNIANAMYKHKLISTKLDSECSNGLIASVNAWNVYQDHADPTNSEIMKDIIKYNEFDCKVLWDILRYLRKNH
jgi:hypothetical protein